MMKYLWLLMCCMVSSVSYANVISWDASSGLIPSDPTIDEASRFVLSGDSSWLSLENGYMNISDSSNVNQLNFQNFTTVPTDQGSDWAFEVELRMNSDSRPEFDYGVSLGITVENKRSFIAIANDGVGFLDDVDYLNGQSFSLDTTDDFHIYKVTKTGDTVSLYMDEIDTPVISLNYGLFPVYEGHGTSVTLAMTSNPGMTDFDIKKFSYVPEPATLSFVALGGIILRKRIK